MHIGKLELSVLHLGKTLTELLTFLHILYGFFHGAFAYAKRLAGDTYTAAVERLHGYGKALAFFTQQVFLGNYAVFHYQFAGGAAADAHLLLLLTNGEAGEVLFYYKGGNALGAGGLVGHGKYDINACIAGIGYEYLGTVEHVVVALKHGGGLLTGGVCTGAGFGKAERAYLLAAEQGGQILHLLLLGAVLEYGGAAQ